VTTGISAHDRAATIRTIARPKSGPNDLVQPGHIFPLRAKEGGVLRRAGHTEAAVDLARMAGLQPAGVLCEILDEVGNRANRIRLFELAREHKLEIISIEETDLGHIVSILSGQHIVKVIATKEEAEELKPGQILMGTSVTFSPPAN
jgi:3,4-dihydroxy-2-butanone 4-phosphate synthase